MTQSFIGHRRTSRQTARDETRGAILDAAEHLLTCYGYGKMTMNDLAEEAEVGVGTIYLHFPGKADIAVAAIARANQAVIERQEYTAVSDAPVEARLREVLTQRVFLRLDRVCRQRHTLEELRTAIREQSGLREQAALWRARETELVAGLLAAGQDDGSFEIASDIAHTADALLGATEAFLPRNLTQADLEEPHRVRERTEGIIALLLCAIRRRGA